MKMTKIAPLVGAALVAGGVVASQASANVSLVCAPDGVEVSLTNYPKGKPVSVSYDVGGVTGTRDFVGPSTSFVVPVSGDVTAVVRQWRDVYTATVHCQAPPPPPEPPAPPPAPPAEPPPPPPVSPPAKPPVKPPAKRTFDCAWVRSHYSPALRVQVQRKLGLRCGFTKPAVICTDLLRVGAGPKWYTRFGFPYRCRVNPPVAG